MEAGTGKTRVAVALLVSAWIETFSYSLSNSFNIVALLVSAWIETYHVSSLIRSPSSHSS